MRSIVSTMPGGAVAVTRPTSEAMTFLTNGGVPDGYFGRKLDREWEIDKFTRNGTRESIAVRWIDAIISGGCTDAEAYELIRDKDTHPNWSGIELWDEQFPTRWFRDAWRRSHNGGPIRIDMAAAVGQQIRHLGEAIDLNLRQARARLDIERVSRIEEIDLSSLRSAMERAKEPDQLRAVWPNVLS